MSIRHFFRLFLVSITMFNIFGCACLWQPSCEANSLMYRVKNGDLRGVESLLADGANVNAKYEYGWTPLIAASWEGHEDVVKLLLAKRANVNAKDSGGQTALIMAATADHREIAEVLIAKGADIDAKADDGTTALMRASSLGHKDVEELLREHQAH